MPIITIATTKGGAGKTTLARLLVGYAAQHGYKTAALDADRTRSLADWITRFRQYPVEVRSEIDETAIIPTVSALQENHDFIVIDTAGASTQATVFAIGCADLVLVPLKLSSSDVTEAIKTMGLIKSAAAMQRRDIPARAVFMGFKPRTSIAAHVEAEIAKAQLPAMNARLHDLVAFEEMTFNGTIPGSGMAGSQTEALFEEALALAEK